MTEARDFWSRRRARVAAEVEETHLAEAEALVAEQHAELEEKSDEEILAELDLPDPDSLAQGDDFSVFMAKAVPDRIRRRALRKLWRTNPVLANVDQLVDYGEDFTDGATIVENLQTAYQVGKGMLKHVEEMARKAEAEDDAAEIEDDDDTKETDDIANIEEYADVADPEETGEIWDAAHGAEEMLDAPAKAPRRMKFRIEESA